jgi:hypothetical protein
MAKLREDFYMMSTYMIVFTSGWIIPGNFAKFEVYFYLVKFWIFSVKMRLVEDLILLCLKVQEIRLLVALLA